MPALVEGIMVDIKIQTNKEDYRPPPLELRENERVDDFAERVKQRIIMLALGATLLFACTDHGSAPYTRRDAEVEQALALCEWLRNCMGGDTDLAECANAIAGTRCARMGNPCDAEYEEVDELRACIAAVDVRDCFTQPADCAGPL